LGASVVEGVTRGEEEGESSSEAGGGATSSEGTGQTTASRCAAKPINRGAPRPAIRLRQYERLVVHAVRQESLAEEDVMA